MPVKIKFVMNMVGWTTYCVWLVVCWCPAPSDLTIHFCSLAQSSPANMILQKLETFSVSSAKSILQSFFDCEWQILSCHPLQKSPCQANNWLSTEERMAKRKILTYYLSMKVKFSRLCHCGHTATVETIPKAPLSGGANKMYNVHGRRAAILEAWIKPL